MSEWTLMLRMAEDISWDDAEGSSLYVRPAAVDRALIELTAEERDRLLQLVQADLARQKEVLSPMTPYPARPVAVRCLLAWRCVSRRLLALAAQPRGTGAAARQGPGVPPGTPETISPGEFNRLFEAYALLQAQRSVEADRRAVRGLHRAAARTAERAPPASAEPAAAHSGSPAPDQPAERERRRERDPHDARRARARGRDRAATRSPRPRAGRRGRSTCASAPASASSKNSSNAGSSICSAACAVQAPIRAERASARRES